ncbi:MAG: hypothetical protein ABIH00_11375 [Armatimonadota bacterium]
MEGIKLTSTDITAGKTSSNGYISQELVDYLTRRMADPELKSNNPNALKISMGKCIRDLEAVIDEASREFYSNYVPAKYRVEETCFPLNPNIKKIPESVPHEKYKEMAYARFTYLRRRKEMEARLNDVLRRIYPDKKEWCKVYEFMEKDLLKSYFTFRAVREGKRTFPRGKLFDFRAEIRRGTNIECLLGRIKKELGVLKRNGTIFDQVFMRVMKNNGYSVYKSQLLNAAAQKIEKITDGLKIKLKLRESKPVMPKPLGLPKIKKGSIPSGRWKIVP